MRTTEPTQITTREKVVWTKSYADYPATEWTLAYYFRGPGTGFNATGTADGDEFVVTVLGTTTATVDRAGKYKWEAWVTNIADTTIKYSVGVGFTNIVLGLDTASVAPVDLRSVAQKIVDAIDDALLTSAGDVIEYEVSTSAGSKKVKRSRTEAIATRKEYAAIVAKELAAERSRQTGKVGRLYLGRMP